jgi:hypothetical protein
LTFIGDSSEADLKAAKMEAALIRLVLSDAQRERVAPLLLGLVIQAGWQLELGRWFVSYTSGSEF